nr:DUF6516 family protein [uncultured Enterobacter sp.]
MTSVLYKKFTRYLSESDFIQVLIWEIDPPVHGSTHNFKYSLAYVVNEVCLMRYDNERGKGDHKHMGNIEIRTTFVSIEQLIADFLADVERIRHHRR